VHDGKDLHCMIDLGKKIISGTIDTRLFYLVLAFGGGYEQNRLDASKADHTFGIWSLHRACCHVWGWVNVFSAFK